MSSTPHPGPPPQRITVDAEQLRQLVAEQFPHWADLPVRPVSDGGWDNWTFHLGDDMLARLPSAKEYALAVGKEHRWLPVLAPQLPLLVPVPLAEGRPGAGYPYPWSVYRWVDGEPVRPDQVADRVGFAVDLARFLAALQSIDAADGPQPGQHNWFRGATLRTYHDSTQRALTALDGHVDVGLVREIWETALRARWDGQDRWFHGDVAQGNLLLGGGGGGGRLVAGGRHRLRDLRRRRSVLRPCRRMDAADRGQPTGVPRTTTGRRGDMGTRARLGPVEDTRRLRPDCGPPCRRRTGHDRASHPQRDLVGVLRRPDSVTR